MPRIHPKTWEDGVMPLEAFPAAHRELIRLAVETPYPPAQWTNFQGGQMESRAWWEWHWIRGRRLVQVAIPDGQYRSKIPLKTRLAVYERDGNRCLHCGSSADLSLDYVHPWSLGGSDDAENLQTLCRPCNSRKGARV